MKKNAIATTEEIAMQLSQERSPLNKTKDSDLTAQRRMKSIAIDVAIMKENVAGYAARSALPMTDTEGIKEQIMHYLDACIIAGNCPKFMDICACLGRDRVSVYSWMRRHPQHETTKMLKVVQTEVAAILANQALQRNVSEVLSIFLLKNSGEYVQLNDNYGIVAGSTEAEEHRSSDEIAAQYAGLLEE